MRSLILLIVSLLFCGSLLSCASSQGKSHGDTARSKVVPDDVAYFAGGCFWGVEHFLQELDGVASVESGFAGGRTDAPSYDDVVTKDTGHLEVVRVRFDSKQVSYRAIAKRFFEIHDPTQADGQGPDIGEQYLSAIFFTTAEQKSVAEELIARLRTRGYDVVTELRSFEKFWPADEYHQDYYVKSGKQPYCHGRVQRFGDSD